MTRDWNRQGCARVSGPDDRSAGGPHHPAPADLATALGDLADATANALRLPQLLDWLGRVLARAGLRSW